MGELDDREGLELINWQTLRGNLMMQIMALSLKIFVGLYSILYLAFWRTDPLQFLHGFFHVHYFHYPTWGHTTKIQPAHIICPHKWAMAQISLLLK